MNVEHDFSNVNREFKLSKSSQTHYDLIVIGGGITGAGIAMDATLRGMKTLLLEKLDFASGTSSKSTKLVHGGLRYLKQLEFGLVRETGLERAIAHYNIPHLVHPERMLLPIVDNGTFNKFSASLAINVYDRLANVPKEHRKINLNKRQCLEAEPLLKQGKLKSGISYSEYRTDDARLTIEIIKSALRSGADVFNYMEVTAFTYENKIVKGVKAQDNIDGKSYNFTADQVVNAAGPWVDNLRNLQEFEEKQSRRKSLHLTKGVHIVIPKEKLNLSTSVYFDAFDGRMIFVIPRAEVVYVGTSDTNYNGNKDSVRCEEEDAVYLINAVNRMFDIPKLSIDDIESNWAGLRPLIHEKGKSPSELSRKDEIFVSNTKLISIAGGKLTGFRKMAERIVDMLCANSIEFKTVSCKTKHYPIHSNSFSDYDDYKAYKSALVSRYKMTPVDHSTISYLVDNYGKNGAYIIDQCLSKNELNFDENLLISEIEYCIEYEAVYYPLDFIERRSGRLYFNIHSVYKYVGFIIEKMANILAWPEEEKTKIKEQTESFVHQHNSIKENDSKDINLGVNANKEF